MHKIIYSIVAMLLLSGVASLRAQVVTTSPSPLQENSEGVEIYFHADKGSQGLINTPQTEAIYAHTGVNIEGPDGAASWQYAPNWGDNNAKYQLTYVSPNLWKLYIGDIRTYYGVAANETVKKLCFVFRSADCKREGKDTGGKDIFVDVLDAGFQLDFQSSLTGSIINSSTGPVTFTAGTTEAATITISVNGNSIGTASDARDLTASYTFTEEGEYKVVCTAVKGETTLKEEINLLFAGNSPQDTDTSLPAQGVTKNADGSYTFCIAAPGKKSVILSGSWNDFVPTSSGLMKYVDRIIAGESFRYFKITMPASEVKSPFTYFYTVDGETSVGDPYARLVLDPEYDRFISSTVYPDMPAYPEQFLSSSITMAYYDDNLLDYDWKVKKFTGADKNDLVIYELLLRDFTGTEGKNDANGTLEQAIKKIPYLKDLGVNAIELLPIQEFNGNISWGYNTNYYFAPDKAYGSPAAYKRFIDECHVNGMAVILDLVFNQSDWQHPWYRMYPSGSNPFYNAEAPHAYSVLNDWNQGYPLVEEQWMDVVKFWLTEYNVDGYRFDLVKGLGNNNSYANPGGAATDAYNQSRIDRMKRIHDSMREVRPDAYFINEDLATAGEENKMAEDGELNWANLNNAACQYAMGWESDSGLNGMDAPKMGRIPGSTVAYLESHDEERMAYKQAQWAPIAVKNNHAAACQRLGSAAAQMILVPGAHMLWQFQEFGYDEGIDTWGGRTDPKPVKWKMLDDPDNKGLLGNYRELIRIRLENKELFSIGENFGNNCSGWANGRTIITKSGDKELYCAINPNVSGDLTVNVDFAETDNSRYWIASKSYGSEPKFDAAAKTITVPAGCYAVVTTRNISGVDEITAEGMSMGMCVYGGRGNIILSGTTQTGIVYDVNGMKLGEVHENAPLSAVPGIYIVRCGNTVSKVMVR